jgi:hypothetical protein
MATKEQINAGFRNLRKAGYFAKQNWWCCQSCGVAAIPETENKDVSYHAQDAERLRETGQTYLNWSGDLGEIRKAFEDAGVPVIQNGSDKQRILIGAHH